jgi:formylglycine-generating enzyme required for sulfatase activity
VNDIPTHAIELPGYRLLRPIGSGGAATVYEAVQTPQERQVAVKVFDVMDAASVARLEQLLRADARLAHPNILSIDQIGRTADGRLFHTMPLLPGADAARRNLHLKPLHVAAILRQLLAALEYAHRRGVVHGGIKPANVLFDPNGRAYLADFGVARWSGELGRPHPDAAAYLSPEQTRGHPPGQRSDLYSMGALAWTFLTGAPPFAGDNAIATAIAQVEQPVPKLPPIAAAWQGWVDKALAKAPERRFQSAREMADALASFDGKRPRGGSGGAKVRLQIPKPALIGTAALVVVATLALAGWAAWKHRAPGNIHATTLPTMPATSPTAATQPLAPAEPTSTATLTDRTRVLLAAADALRAGNHWLSPKGNNALERYIAVLTLDPHNADATAGVDAMLDASRQRLESAWRGRRTTRANALQQQGEALTLHPSPKAASAWRTARASLGTEVGTAVVSAADARNEQGLAALKPLAQAVPAVYPTGFSMALAEQRVAIPLGGTKLRDHGGPLLVYVPASGKTPAFAIARVEVTRAEYAAFAQATGRPAARCLAAHNPFSRMSRLSWQAPGFAQAGNQPAVCVSWDDALAYAEWLSQRTGKPYRLPTSGQWLRAAGGAPQGNACQLGNVDDVSRKNPMDNDRWPCNDGAAQTAPVGGYAASGVGAYDMYGNVSEWLAGGDAGKRAFRGLSWRDGSHQTPFHAAGTAAADVGYNSVGVRVVRVIDATHPAPPRADAGH